MLHLACRHFFAAFADDFSQLTARVASLSPAYPAFAYYPPKRARFFHAAAHTPLPRRL
ncbi:hypothetical protein GT037_004896 [Alternaria burnsii]|uniref:Uncharacterized protein n=1 Tax=Alternaria burnsii TaxID=1187904 RepID=A0A8H7B8R0_9PLEO|nr:uncharacterized protein GT037_004896 [Alternaria burnsii]KAF7676684.1 hypothetical protein GT037_004896 [Alternaria burnsii]